MSHRGRRGWRSTIGGFAALAVLAGCSGASHTATPPGFSGFPAGPTTPFKPIQVDGVARCATLTLATQPRGGTTDATLPCLTGPGVLDVDHLGGRPTLVNLWASWCSVCRKEMPVLEAAYRSHNGNIQFVGVDTLDETGPAADFLEQTGADYPQLYDQQGELLKYSRIPGLPVTLLLDADGKEIARHVGELNAEDLQKLLDKA